MDARTQNDDARDDATPMASVLERNISDLHARFQRENRDRGFQERLADRITAFTGSMTFVYLHLVFYGVWIIVNLGWTPLPRFDPTFVILAMEASVEAIFLSTFVLITQNRMAAKVERRADLDLQITLLTEHEVTRMIHMLSEISKRMSIDPAHHADLDELKQDVLPEKVLDRIEATVGAEGGPVKP